MDATGYDDLNFKYLASLLWRRKGIVIAVTGAFVVGAGVLALLLPNKYEASVVVAPVSNEQRSPLGGISGVVSQLGGLASLAGLATGQADEKSETIAILQSRILVEQYIREQNLLPVLFKDEWDAGLKRWRVTDPSQQPTLWKATEYFRNDLVDLKQNAKTGLVTLTVTWTDAQLAAKWANDVAKRTNDYLQKQAIDKSERHIRYLTEQAGKTDIAAVRTAIYAIMELEIRNVMLARGTDEYALKVIDPAVAPEKRSSPKLAVWVVSAFLAGLSISILIVLLRGGEDRG